MPATVFTEKQPANLGFVVSEAEGPFFTRDADTLKAGVALKAGQLLGRETASKKLVPLAIGTTDGSQVYAGFSGYNHDAVAVDRKILNWSGPGEVRLADVTFPAGATDNDKATIIAAVNAKGVKFR
jgi:hypothetical protein